MYSVYGTLKNYVNNRLCGIVLYGAYLNKEGIDIEDQLKCEQVFEITWDILESKDMDSLGPFHPEDDGYVVTKVVQGEYFFTYGGCW